MKPERALLAAVTTLFLAVPFCAFGSTIDGTIVSGGNNGYAWSDQAGWVNFGATNGTIHVSDSGITGYAWNPKYGWINMAPTHGGVEVSASGTLSGYAWGEGLGWIDFSAVSIDQSGTFTGHASGTNVGTLTFDCAHCSVRTDYRPQQFRSSSTSSNPVSESEVISASGFSARTISAPPTGGAEKPDSGDGATRLQLPTDTTTNQGSSENQTAGPLRTQLFDIRLLLGKRNISKIGELVAQVTFESFGNVPTPVLMTFTILSEDGRELWESEDTVTVETEQVFRKEFSDAPPLAPGTYTLKLHTLYNTQVTDDFTATFTISSQPDTDWNWILMLCCFACIVILIFVFILWRRKKKKAEDGTVPSRMQPKDRA